MKKVLPIIALVLLGSFCPKANAQYLRAYGFCETGGQNLVTSGLTGAPQVQASYPGATVTVYNHGTVTVATIYADPSGTPLSNPFACTANAYWFFYGTPSTEYDVQISGGGLSTPFTFGDIVVSLSIFQALGTANTWTALQTFNAGITGTGTTGSLTAGPGILGTANTWTALQTFNSGISGAGNTGALTAGSGVLSANTFTGLQTFNAGLSSSGPNTLNGGGALAGTFTGSPTLSGNPTFSGNPVFSGNPNFSGSPTFGLVTVSAIGLGGSPPVFANSIRFGSGGTSCIYSLSNCDVVFSPGGISFPVAITSTVATGTAPLAIASTTLVPNLNVQLVNSVSFANQPAGANYVCASTSVTACSWTLIGNVGQEKVECANPTAVTVLGSGANEQNLMSCTIPANELAGNQVLRSTATGYVTNNSGSTTTYHINVYLDSTLVATVGLQSPTGLVSGATYYWTARAYLMLVAAGSSGSIVLEGDGIGPGSLTANIATFSASAQTISFDTTASHVIQITGYQLTSSGSSSVTETELLTERIG